MTEQVELYYDQITQICLERAAVRPRDLTALAVELMGLDGFPMHAPVHHYLVPAVLLTVCRSAQGHGRDVLERDLSIALERAKDVPGGVCGYWGACGACVGVGIFWSVITDTTPLSSTSWAYGNRAVGEALLSVAQAGGPRCCKRCSILSLTGAVPQIRQVLGVDVQAGEFLCPFHGQNGECLRECCPYYPGEEIRLPVFAYPKKDLEHPCPCQNRPVELTHKKGKLYWRKAEGEAVEEGESVADLEVEKKSLEVLSPASGVIFHMCYNDGDEVDAECVLGYIRQGEAK